MVLLAALLGGRYDFHMDSASSKQAFTDDVLDERMVAILRGKTPAERLEMAFALWRFARDLIRRTAAREHPEWTEAELDRHVAQRMSHGAV